MIDIVIVTYNRKDLLKSIIEKLSEQTIKDVNVIVCDDGSKEHLNFQNYNIIKKYIYTIDNGYHRVARFNEGINYCSSENVILMDDDCVPVYPDFIEQHIKNLNNFPVSRGLIQFDDGSIADGWFSCANVGFRTNVLKDLGCYDMNYDGYYGYEDHDLGNTIKKREIKFSGFEEKTKVLHLGKEYKDGDRSDAVMRHNREYYNKKWEGFKYRDI